MKSASSSDTCSTSVELIGRNRYNGPSEREVGTMIKKEPAAPAKKSKPKKARPKSKRQGPSNAQLRELMKKNKPPQSWYDEDHTGLY
jgi:hypothetical protein